MKKNIFVKISKNAVFAICLALATIAFATKDARHEKRAKEAYRVAKNELASFLNERDSLLQQEFERHFRENLPQNKLKEFFTDVEINRLNEMIQTHPFDEKTAYIINIRSTYHPYTPFLVGRNLHDIVLTPESTLQDFWACAMAFKKHEKETANFSTPFIVGEFEDVKNPKNCFDTLFISNQRFKNNDTLLIIKSAKYDFQEIIYKVPETDNLEQLLQSDTEKKLYEEYTDARTNLFRIQTRQKKKNKVSEKPNTIATAPKMKTRQSTQLVMENVKKDIKKLEFELDARKTNVQNSMKFNPEYKLRESLGQKQLDTINQQLKNWYVLHPDDQETFSALTLDNTIFDLADYVHILSADIVYEPDDGTEIVWANQKLQTQWLKYQTTIAHDSLYEKKDEKIRDIMNEICKKQKTLHQIDSLHNEIYNKRICASIEK